MDSQRLSVEEVFLQAVQEEPADRQAFLDTACADSKVRTRVEALLRAHDRAGDFMAVPAVQALPAAAAAEDTLDFLEPCATPGRLGVLAHYEILEVLGRGGMGIVLRGVDVKLNRIVAIKVLAPQLAANAMARRRFLREAQAAAAVSHDHVVTIHAVDEFKGLPYMVMECIVGPSLQQNLDASGALTLTPILRIGMQIASGLAAAHAHGLVHRDIKPANILLENGIERVKITDFGLARSVDDVRITQAGTVYGTPQYMSPEQAQGERVDQRSDLFSLGSLMYAMCTGRPPFRGDTSLAVLKRVCEDTPRPIAEVNPDIPAPLAAIVDRLLAKDPDARFQSTSEVAEPLSRYLVHLQRDPHAPFQVDASAPPRLVRADRAEPTGQPPPQRPARARLPRPLLVGAAVLFMGSAVLAALEGARVTNWTGLAANGVTPPAGLTPTPAAPRPTRRYAAGASDRPVKVYVLAGDSNMAGRATIAVLKYQAIQPNTKERYQHLFDGGDWAVREDVWIKNFRQTGNLTVGFGQSPDRFGPELEFGHVVGNHFDEQVLLIKTCWGGHDLVKDFRSPSAGTPPVAVLERMRKELQKAKPNVTLADVEKLFGGTYRAMLTEVRETLAKLDVHFPGYRGQGHEVAGFVWFSGWNDMVNYNPFYAENLAHFIRDVRNDLNHPKLPFVIGQMGVYGHADPGTEGANFRAAQAEAAQLPEFAGNVKLVVTDPVWDHEAHAVFKKGYQNHRAEWDKVGSDAPYHYLGSPRTFCALGKAFGAAMLELHRAALGPATSR